MRKTIQHFLQPSAVVELVLSLNVSENSFCVIKKLIHKTYLKIIFQSFTEALTFQPEFAEPIVNISVAIGRDATFTCHVRHLGGYRVNIRYYRLIDFPFDPGRC